MWIETKTEKPKTMSLVLVVNMKGWMLSPTKAIYHPDSDVFVAYDPYSRESYTLEATHWMLVPGVDGKGY